MAEVLTPDRVRELGLPKDLGSYAPWYVRGYRFPGWCDCGDITWRRYTGKPWRRITAKPECDHCEFIRRYNDDNRQLAIANAEADVFYNLCPVYLRQGGK